MTVEPGKLYLVPTPIGNLADMTYRAVEVLKNVDLILAEDTRTSGFLLKHYEIGTPAQSFHAHNDAGTPGISDPGFLLVREALANEIPVDSLPGATAFVPALVKSGFPCDRFIFEGFLPHKNGRQTRIETVKDEKRTIVYYESPHRLLKTLQQFKEILGERNVSVSRELTKKFEETVTGSIDDVIAHFNSKSIKGEFVIVLEGTK